jgi:hypothetical protein
MNKQMYGMLIAADGVMSVLAFGVVWQFVEAPAARALAGLGIFGSLAATAWILKQRVQD